MTIRRSPVPDSSHVRLTCTACNSAIVLDPAKVDVDVKRREHKTNCPERRGR